MYAKAGKMKIPPEFVDRYASLTQARRREKESQQPYQHPHPHDDSGSSSGASGGGGGHERVEISDGYAAQLTNRTEESLTANIAKGAGGVGKR